MLTPRQNLIQTIRGGHPDRFVNQYEAFAIIAGSPFNSRNPSPAYGQENVVNAWGVTRSWPLGTPGAFPVHTPDRIVIRDIENWRSQLNVPSVEFDPQEWESFVRQAEQVDRSQQFVTPIIAPGIFEQCHYLMEIQNCLLAFYEYPEEMHEIIDCLTQFELDYGAQLCKYLKPDAIFHHDDWGSQISTFLSPDMFREFLKPAYEKIYGFYRSQGVELIVHHSDSYAATLVPDMIDMGIDIWQGVMTTNNISKLIQTYGGQISFMGGIDSASVDFAGWTREIVAREVRRACETYGALYFIPSASQGLPVSTFPGVYQAISEEIDICSSRCFPKEGASLC